MSEKLKRPEFVKDEHLEFLDGLRESGVTNMFGATPFLQKEFVLDKYQSGEILAYWMGSFGDSDR